MDKIVESQLDRMEKQQKCIKPSREKVILLNIIEERSGKMFGYLPRNNSFKKIYLKD